MSAPMRPGREIPRDLAGEHAATALVLVCLDLLSDWGGTPGANKQPAATLEAAVHAARHRQRPSEAACSGA